MKNSPQISQKVVLMALVEKVVGRVRLEVAVGVSCDVVAGVLTVKGAWWWCHGGVLVVLPSRNCGLFLVVVFLFQN